MAYSISDASSFLELSLKETGREICIAEKYIRFTPKQYPLLHYVYAGQGEFIYRGKTYELKAGDCFLIHGGEEAIYRSYEHDPWSYFWIGLGGTKAQGLLEYAGVSNEHPVLHDKERRWKQYFEDIYDSFFEKGSFGIDCLGHLYLLLGDISRSLSKKSESSSVEKGHIQAAKAYIRNNFQFPITIDNIAHSVGVTPNYLANLFASQAEMSPKKYLTLVRMETARDLLLTTSSSVTDISRAVGYGSPLYFSKVFSTHYGVSPLHYRIQGENIK